MLVPAAVWIFLPGMERYRGLSGLDSAFFALLAAEVLREKWREGRRLWALAVLAAALAFAGKIAWELATGTAVFVDSAAAGMVPVPLAHLVGAACGAAVGALEPFQGSVSPRRRGGAERDQERGEQLPQGRPLAADRISSRRLSVSAVKKVPCSGPPRSPAGSGDAPGGR